MSGTYIAIVARAIRFASIASENNQTAPRALVNESAPLCGLCVRAPTHNPHGRCALLRGCFEVAAVCGERQFGPICYLAAGGAGREFMAQTLYHNI